MRLRRMFRTWASLLAAAFVLCACSSATPTPQVSFDSSLGHPLFWEVTDAQGHTLYLFGSIHVGDDSAYPLPEMVNQAYASSDTLAVEADVLAASQDAALMSELLRGFLYPDGTSVADHLPAELYQQARSLLIQRGLYTPQLDTYNPVFWYMLVSEGDPAAMTLTTDKGVDLHFLARAHAEGKPILEIEPIEEHYAYLTGLDEQIGVYLLNNAVQYAPMLPIATQRMYNAWKVGNASALTQDEAVSEQLDPETRDILLRFNDQLLHQRNASMTEKAEEYLQSGQTCFYVVGVAHMLGADGIVARLTQKGYTVVQR